MSNFFAEEREFSLLQGDHSGLIVHISGHKRPQ